MGPHSWFFMFSVLLLIFLYYLAAYCFWTNWNDEYGLPICDLRFRCSSFVDRYALFGSDSSWLGTLYILWILHPVDFVN